MKTLNLSLSLLTVTLLSCSSGTKTSSQDENKASVSSDVSTVISEEDVSIRYNIKPFADFPNTPYINYMGVSKPGC